MIHNLKISIEDSTIGQYVSFATEKPSNMDEYCRKWKISRKNIYEEYEGLLAQQIADIRTQPKFEPKDYERALYKLEIPCGIPLRLIILGSDYCQIDLEFLSPQSVLVEGHDDDMPF
jgi:hypothetical protein